MLSIPGHWVWDFWFADDGQRHHVFFLHAPKSLGDEQRRHRAARIGHAVSADLRNWDLVQQPFGPGAAGDFDATTTWTGSVVRGPDGLWRMFYTGTCFLADEPDPRNIETIGVAVSRDLVTWTKRPGPVCTADPRWYETLATLRESERAGVSQEAWRDPWVFADPTGDGWHMLVTARSNSGALDERGVIGHATSADLERWEVREPLSPGGSGFAHLEVSQVAEIDGRWFLLFSCLREELSAGNRDSFGKPGTWSVPINRPDGPYDVSAARPLTDYRHYSGRLARGRDGRWYFFAFENALPGDELPGVISDPIPVSVTDAGLAIEHR